MSDLKIGDESEIRHMMALKFGDKVEIKEGKFKGSVGIVKNVWTVTHIQVDFIGARKSMPIDYVEPSNKTPTSLLFVPQLGEYLNSDEAE
jgi:hypothetical protein